MARRRLDPRPRDARLARRGRAHRLCGRFLPGPAGAGPGGFPEDREPRPEPGRIPGRPRRGGPGPLRPLRPASRESSSSRDSSTRRCPASRSAAGPSSASTATPTRRPGSGSNPSIPASRPGGYLIVDDYGLIPECRAAVDDLPARARDRRADREGRLERRSAGDARTSRPRGPQPGDASRPPSTPSSARAGRAAGARTRSPPSASSSWSASCAELRRKLGNTAKEPE